MSVSIEDLQPKSFKVTVKGVELTCKPLRLSHALTLSKVGEIFQNTKDATPEEIQSAEKQMDGLVGELIPELKEVQLDVGSILELLGQMMETIQPTDNKELEKNGVKFDTDPKVEKTG